MTNETTRRCLILHAQAYPRLQIQDLFKYLHQSAFGCEHLVASLQRAVDYIEREFAACATDPRALVEPLDGAYSRVSLVYLREGLRAETLGKLFCASARYEPSGMADLQEKLAVAETLVRKGELPFSAEAFEGARREWEAQGYPAVRHSETFRASYAPAYRVIANRYVPLLPLWAKIDRRLDTGDLAIILSGGDEILRAMLLETLEMLYPCVRLAPATHSGSATCDALCADAGSILFDGGEALDYCILAGGSQGGTAKEAARRLTVYAKP